MKAGKLDRRLSVKTSTFAQDAAGQPVATETTLATIWAHKMEQRPSEVFNAGSDKVLEQIIFQVRYRTDITTSMVVVYKTNRFEIKGITEVGRNNRMNLICERMGESA